MAKKKPKTDQQFIDELLRDPDRPRASLKIVCRSDANDALRERIDVEARQANLNAVLTRRVADLRDAFAEAYNALDGRHDALDAALQHFAKTDRDNWGSAKTLVLAHGELQFHLREKAAVLPLNSDADEAAALAKGKALLAKGTRWVKKLLRKVVTIKWSWNKNEILAAHRDGTVTDARLASVGLRVDQPEDFRIVLHTEDAAL